MAERTRTGFEPARSGWWPGPLDRGAGHRRAAHRRRRTADIVVVGGGLSGLVAADRLAASGASVVVLEARPDRVGGRLETADLDGTPADLGGCFVGAGHTSLRVLIGELGLHTTPAYRLGERVTRRGGRLAHAGLARRVTARAVEHGVDRFERMAADASSDSRALDSWLAHSSHWPPARAVLRDMLVNVLGAEPVDVSLAHALRYVHSGGGLAAMVGTGRGSQQDLVEGGAQAIATRLADRLGDAVELGAPVRRIERSRAGVRALSDLVEVDAGSAIVALSPALASRIVLPGAPIRRPAALRPGDTIKYVALYPNAFWRPEGLNGMAWGDALPFSFTHDVSAPEGEPGLLAVFVVADRARRLRRLPPAARERAIADALARCFGARAGAPQALAERDWTADEWSLGGYGSAVAPGAGHHRPLATHARIVLAGTESSTEHHGYMEGAVLAAERAVAAVLAAA